MQASIIDGMKIGVPAMVLQFRKDDFIQEVSLKCWIYNPSLNNEMTLPILQKFLIHA
mgnify:CR=1 FL=1